MRRCDDVLWIGGCRKHVTIIVSCHRTGLLNPEHSLQIAKISHQVPPAHQHLSYPLRVGIIQQQLISPITKTMDSDWDYDDYCDYDPVDYMTSDPVGFATYGFGGFGYDT